MSTLRTFQPFAPAVLFRRARPADFMEPAMHRSLRESDLLQREAERSCYRNLDKAVKAHAAVIQMASHGRIGQERAAELAWHDMPRCQGGSCRQGRAECKEGCNPLPEMACTAGEEPPSAWSKWIGILLAPRGFIIAFVAVTLWALFSAMY